MNLSEQLAKHFKELHFGKNWTSSSLKEHLENVDWQMATTQVFSLNTIALLVFHINYYVKAILKVMEGGPLDAKDRYSFDLPPIRSKEDWEKLLETVWNDAEKLSQAIAAFPEKRLWDTFTQEKYGSYFRNFQGLIEHSHYHLGQIVLIKKILENRH